LKKKLEEQFLKNEAEAKLHGHEKQSKEKASERDYGGCRFIICIFLVEVGSSGNKDGGKE